MLKHGLIVTLRAAPQNPTDMRPPAAIARRMRVAIAIRVRMMDSMRCDPLYRTTLYCQRAADYQEVFDGFGNFISSMRQQPVEAHADAEASCDPIEYRRDYDRLPAPEKQRRHGANVKNHHENIVAPIDALFLPGLSGFTLVRQ